MSISEGLPAAIYARISNDPKHTERGVDLQVADCQKKAAELGWVVNKAHIYIDNAVSAYSGVRRPQYEAMLEAIKAGEVKGLIAWHTDRLHRRPTELEEFMKIADAANLTINTVKSGDFDLSTSGGRMIARMLGAAARHEVEHAQERMVAAKKEAAKAGRYRGGPRPYGFEPGGVIVRESEAAVIREATSAVLVGRTLAGIARDLDERGHKTSAGKKWTYSRVREMLLRPRNAGLSAHGLPGRKTYRSRTDKLDKKRYEVEIIGPALWPAIVERQQWDALVALLTDSGRRTQTGNDTRWLGSGIYVCGKCGGKLRPAPYGGTESRPGEKRHLYRCVESAHLTIDTGRTDELVLAEVAQFLREEPDVVKALSPTNAHLTEDRKRRSTLVARLAGFESDYSEGKIPASLWSTSTAKAKAEIKEIDERMAAALRRSRMSSIVAASDPGQAFLDASIDMQRAVVASVVDVIIISAKDAGVRPGGHWTDNRVLIAQSRPPGDEAEPAATTPAT